MTATLASIGELPVSLTTHQAAELLGVGYETLLDAVREGRAPVEPLRVGRRLVWPTARVLAALGLSPPGLGRGAAPVSTTGAGAMGTEDDPIGEDGTEHQNTADLCRDRRSRP